MNFGIGSPFSEGPGPGPGPLNEIAGSSVLGHLSFNIFV